MGPFLTIMLLILVTAVALLAFRIARQGGARGRAGHRSQRRATTDDPSYSPIYYAGAGDAGHRGGSDSGRFDSTGGDSPSSPSSTPDAGGGSGDGGNSGGGDGGGGGGGGDGGSS